MKKGLLYILIHYSSAVIADWITVEHDFKMCDQVIPSYFAAFHINDDGVSYSTSLLIRDIQTISHEPPLTTVNITMWGCTFDCNFSFMVKINRNDLLVTSFTEKNLNNYKCNLSNYTLKLIPNPKITYKNKVPNPDHVFPTDLTAQYCKEGKHPDAPNKPIKQTEHIAECIDLLTGNEIGTYAASLQFGSGSSFSPDHYPVATYHMINSANKLFDHWEIHHRGYHDALKELSVKMTPDNLKELIPPPPPPPKTNWLTILVIIGVGFAVLALCAVGSFLAGSLGGAVAATSEVAAETAAAEDVVATTAEGSGARGTAQFWIDLTLADRANPAVEEFNQLYSGFDGIGFDSIESVCTPPSGNPCSAVEALAGLYEREGTTDSQEFQQWFLNNVFRFSRDTKRDTVPENIGFYSANMMNVYFLPSLMDDVHQSFTGNGQNYPDVSSYLSAASEHLQFHFEDTLHNNFFAANKSILNSFTVNLRSDNYKLIDNDDDVYYSIKYKTYNKMAASIISITLRQFNVEICDPKPSFCGQGCSCPTIGDDNCVIAASEGQIKELNFLRDTSDICSTNTTKTGWNITHNSNCDRKQFRC